MIINPKIQHLSEFMQKELNANAHKGDWENDFKDIDKILLEIEWHKAKLLYALKKKDTEKIHEHIADCANEFLFLANAVGMV